MEGIHTTVLIIHTLIALAIVALVLLQRGKGAEAGAAFGAGASGTVFGARGSSNFFSRATAVLATAFFATSLALAYISSQSSGAPESLLEEMPVMESDEPVEEAPPMDDEAPALPELDSAAPAVEDVQAPAVSDQPEADQPAGQEPTGQEPPGQE
jgi:preprotein translocase subunit SecG